MDISLIMLLTLHIVICFAFLAFFGVRKVALAVYPVVLFVPFIGLLVIFIVYLYGKLRKNAREYEKEEVFLKTGKMVNINQIDQEKEKNIVPVEEALIVNDNETQRYMVMEIAKRDSKRYIKELKKALMAADTETAHYAAASILELKREYDKDLISAQKAYEQDKTQKAARSRYIMAIDNIIEADLNLEAINKSYKEVIVQLLIEDINMSEKPSEESFEKLIEYQISLNEHTAAQKWMNRYHEIHSRSEKMLKMQMEMAYKLKDNDLLKKSIKEIENADFVITQKTLDMVDFWQHRYLNDKEPAY